MLKILKYHWFGLILSVFGLMYIGVFLLVLFSPRQDKLGRGFIPCTKTMTKEMFSCEESKSWCMAKAIVKNTYCDTRVVFGGFGLWISGEQSTPWANYLFTPELETVSPQENEELLQYYQENPNIQIEMENLDQERQTLEKKLEKIKDEHPQPTN